MIYCYFYYWRFCLIIPALKMLAVKRIIYFLNLSLIGVVLMIWLKMISPNGLLKIFQFRLSPTMVGCSAWFNLSYIIYQFMGFGQERQFNQFAPAGRISFII